MSISLRTCHFEHWQLIIVVDAKFQILVNHCIINCSMEVKRRDSLFTFYMGKPVCSRFGQMVAKIRDWQPKNGRESLELVSKMIFKIWNTNFRLKHFVQCNRTTLSDLQLLPKIFHWRRHEKPCSIHFLTRFCSRFFKSYLARSQGTYEIPADVLFLITSKWSSDC